MIINTYLLNHEIIFFYLDYSDLFRKTPPGQTIPREFSSWPVIGGITKDGKRTPTIDPRPFTPISTGINVMICDTDMNWIRTKCNNLVSQ